MNLTLEDISRKVVLSAIVIVGLIIIIIDASVHNNRLGITIDTSYIQLMGIGMVVAGTLIAGFMSKRCPLQNK